MPAVSGAEIAGGRLFRPGRAAPARPTLTVASTSSIRLIRSADVV